jgi:gliding motility-associated-like protein
MSETMLIMLHEDLSTGNTSLVIIMDEVNDGTGGNGSVTFNCLPSTAFVQFSDDSGELSGTPPTITGNFNWAACCTDGGIIGGVGCGSTFTINPNLTNGVNTFSLVHGTQANPVYIPMPQLNCPITINCGGTACCQEAFEFSAATTNASCEDSPDGSIDLSTSCSTNPTFIWSTGATTEDLNGLLPGTYSITISDANGCTQAASYNVGFQSSAPSPSITGPGAFCAGDFAELNVSGSYAGYAWSNGMNTSNILVSTPGTYTVTVSNAAGCTGTASATLVQNPVPNVSISGPSTFCLNSSVSLNAGPGFATYQWSGGQTTQSITASEVGVYFVTVTNSFGCTSTDFQVLSPLPTPFPVITGPTTLCSGNPVSLDAGPGFDSYLWSTGNSTQTLGVSAAGNYAVTVTYSSGCTGTASTTLNTSPSDTTLLFQTSCNPADTGIFVQSFTNQFGCDSLEIQTVSFSLSDSVFISLQSCNPADTGTITEPFLNQYGCDSIVVTSTSLLPSNSLVLTAFSCNPEDTGTVIQNLSNQFGCDSTVITNTFFIQADTTLLSATTCDPAEAGIFIDSLSGSDGCDSIVITTITFIPADTTFFFQESCSPADTGIFYTTLVNYYGCDSVLVNSVSLLPSSLTLLSQTSCDPELAGVDTLVYSNLYGCDSIVVTTTTYSSADSTFLYDTSCDPAATGIFQVVLQSSDGCDSIVTTTVSLLPTDTVLVSAQTCDPSLAGVTQTLLTNQYGCDSLVIATTTLLPSDTTYLSLNTCDPSQAGNSSQILQNAFGCDSIVFITATYLPPDTTLLNATTCDPSQAGIFQLSLTNSQGCDSLVITSTTLLPSDTTLLQAYSCDPGQVGTSSSTLSNQYGCDSTVITQTFQLPLDTTWVFLETCLLSDTGTVFTLLTNQYGCDSLVVQVTSLLPAAACELEVLVANDTIGCQANTGAILLTLLNGSAPYSYAWSNGAGNSGTGTISQLNVPVAVANLLPGNYTFILTDPNGLSATVSAFIYQPAPLQLNLAVSSDYNGSDLSCHDAADGAAFVTASGGIPPYTYLWTNGSTTAQSSGLAAGTAAVTVTAGTGCTAIGSVSLAAPSPLAFNFTLEQPGCLSEGSGNILLTQVSGGSGAYQFSLNGISWQSEPLFELLPPGEYLLVARDGNGCESTASAVLIPYTPPFVSLGEDQELSFGDSLTLLPQVNLPPGALSDITWSGADCSGCPAITIKPLVTTTYGIIITDTSGCQAGDELLVIVRKDFPYYVPNIFSPDYNGINDYFTVFSGPQVTRILELKVFDRWGELVYSNEDFLPSDPSTGWDGTFRGEDLSPGVFVYLALIELIDGSTKLLKGEVTLVR